MRRMRRQAEWKVETHIFSAASPTRSTTRERISSAALLVKVMARIPHGAASPVAMRWAMRRVRHPGLARAGAGHDQQRPAPVLDGRPLGQGQVVEQRGRVARERAGLGGRAAPAAAPVVRRRQA